MKGKGCKNLWLYLGIISGFLLGLSWFALAVYTHSHNKTRLNATNANSPSIRAGTTQ